MNIGCVPEERLAGLFHMKYGGALVVTGWIFCGEWKQDLGRKILVK